MPRRPTRQDFVRQIKRAVNWADKRIWPGARTLVGLLAMVGGILGFLPILGFWMLPVGVALIALDVPPLRRRLLRWSADGEAEATSTPPQPGKRS